MIGQIEYDNLGLATLPPCDHGDSSHFVQFYENDSFLMGSVARFVGAGLAVGDRVLVVATPDHRRGIEAMLQSGCLDLARAVARGDLVWLDAGEALAGFMAGGMPEPALFSQQIGGLIARLGADGRRVRAFGEMVAVLWGEGNSAATIALEDLWNDLARKHSFSLFCAYRMDAFAEEAQSSRFRHICSQHSQVLPSEDYSALTDSQERLCRIAVLQQRARAFAGQAARLNEAENARRLLASIVDSSDDAIISKSLEGIITSWNASAVRIFGYSAEEMIGQSVAKLFPRDRLGEEDEILAQLRRGERVDHFETVRMRKDGTAVEVSLTISPVRDVSGALIGASKIARDITAQKRAERAVRESEGQLRRHNERLGLLNEAAGHLLAAEDPAAMVQGLFHRVRGHLGADIYYSFIFDEACDSLSLLSCEGLSQEAQRQMARPEDGQTIPGASALERLPIVASHVQDSTDPGVEMIKELGARAYVCNPLLANHRLLGTLSFASTIRDSFQADELEFIRTLCHYVAIAYDRVRLLGKLREEDKKKDEFLATIAHELRNPLAPLRSSLDLFRLGPQNGATHLQLYEIMARQVHQLTRLVDDLLEMSRITSGKISLRREVLDIATVLQNGIDTSGPLIEKGHHKLTLSLAPEPVLVDGDPVRLAQVFANLLNNAAKYTEEKGHIELTLKRVGGEAVISVRDNGVGIPPEMLPRVFDMFAQIDRTLNRAQGGLGIGLALAKRLVELHGGRIEAASEGPGKGSEFVVRLAAVEGCDKAASLDAPGGSNQRAVRRRRILVVDDNRDAARSLSLLLQTFKHTTRVAFDGAQAMEMATDFHPEVVLLDIGLPHVNGYEVARRLRSGNGAAPLTLIALTGWGQEDDRRRAKEAGFDYHFTKPVDIDALITLLETGGNLAR